MGHYDEQREAMEKKLSNVSFQETKKNQTPAGAWYDYEKKIALGLPPVGEPCQYTLTGSFWFECTIVSLDNLVINCPHIAEMCDNGNGLQWVTQDDIQFRPTDWNKQPKQQALSPEVAFHLSNAFNEIQASARLLSETDPRKSALAGIAGAVNAVREVAL